MIKFLFQRSGFVQNAFFGLKHPRFLTITLQKHANDNWTKTTFPGNMKHDWIGPPDPKSNLRMIRFHIPPDETPAETKYRLMRDEVQKWNHQFWSKHNENFVQQKELFIKEKLEAMQNEDPQFNSKTEAETNVIVARQLSLFYKQFLDSNYVAHRDYNWEWYRKNVGLLWPAAIVQIQRLFRRKARR